MIAYRRQLPFTKFIDYGDGIPPKQPPVGSTDTAALIATHETPADIQSRHRIRSRFRFHQLHASGFRGVAPQNDGALSRSLCIERRCRHAVRHHSRRNKDTPPTTGSLRKRTWKSSVCRNCIPSLHSLSRFSPTHGDGTDVCAYRLTQRFRGVEGIPDETTLDAIRNLSHRRTTVDFLRITASGFPEISLPEECLERGTRHVHLY